MHFQCTLMHIFSLGPEGETGCSYFYSWFTRVLNKPQKSQDGLPEVTWLSKCRNGSPWK